MEALFIFIIKSSGLIALFYFAYYFLLRKETFFSSSRWFLLAGLITSVILPLVIYTKVIWVDPIPVTYTPVSYSPVINHSNVSLHNTQIVEEESFEINWALVSLAVYTLGFAALMIKFGIDFYSLNSVLKGRKIKEQADFKFVDVNENIAPFSYFDYIVYNSSLYSEAELESILEHEKVHSDQNHTIDVIISRIFCILFWFNPIIWLYKKAILQNLEFIADHEASKKLSDKKAYQYTLLKITTHETCVAITNHFYQSLIKKRIVMLNKNQSNKWNYWKYYAIIPALGAFVLLFQIKTIAQEKKAKNTDAKEISVLQNQDSETFKITKSTTDQELKELTAKLKTEHNTELLISDLKRNSAGEIISIKIQVLKENGKKQIIAINSSKAIEDCNIVLNNNDNGSKNVTLSTGSPEEPAVIESQNVVIKDFEDSNDEETEAPEPPIAPNAAGYAGTPTPPTPPTVPIFPGGPIPPVPMDMSKMPKPPVPPKNRKDKAAMSQFEKEMDEFDKKMEAFEPQMAAYEKQVDEIMSKREAIFEKEMEKYEIAMQKFNSEMDKFGQDMQSKYGTDSKEYQMNARQYEQNARRQELNMKQHEKSMKQHEKYMKQQEREMKRWEKESKKS